MPLDRSDRPWMPVHAGSKNKVRLTWTSKVEGRAHESLNGERVDPRRRWGNGWVPTENDILDLLRSGVPREEIVDLLL